MRNSILIMHIPYWFLFFIIVELKPLAIKIIEIIWMPFEWMEQVFFEPAVLSEEFLTLLAGLGEVDLGEIPQNVIDDEDQFPVLPFAFTA